MGFSAAPEASEYGDHCSRGEGSRKVSGTELHEHPEPGSRPSSVLLLDAGQVTPFLSSWGPCLRDSDDTSRVPELHGACIVPSLAQFLLSLSCACSWEGGGESCFGMFAWPLTPVIGSLSTCCGLGHPSPVHPPKPSSRIRATSGLLSLDLGCCPGGWWGPGIPGGGRLGGKAMTSPLPDSLP